MRILFLHLALASAIVGNAAAVNLNDNTFSTDTNIGSATQYFLEGSTGGTTATWTINPGVTVTGGRFFIGTTATPSDGTATFIVNGGGTLNLDRAGTFNLRLGQNGTSESGILKISNGTTVKLSGSTAGAFQEKTGSSIILDGIGSAFISVGTWDAVNGLFTSQTTTASGVLNSGAIPVTATGGAISVSVNGSFTTLTVVDPNPAACWNFDAPDHLNESYGRASLNLAQSGGTSSWSTRANFGDVLANGLNAPYLTATNQAALQPGSGDFSLSLWSMRTSDNATAAGLLDALSVSAGAGWQLFYQANGTLRMRLDDTLGNTVNADTSASQLSLNTWRNIIVTVDRAAKRARFFVNGTEVAPIGGVNISAVTGPIVPDQNLYIGTLNETNPARGQLDDAAIFNRVLTSAEITAINAGGGTPIRTLYPAGVPVPAVAASPASGSILRNGDSVTLASDAGAVIHYTLDGSDPSASSPVYSTPISLSQTTTVKARVVDGSRLGAITSATYLRIPETPPNVVLIVGDDIGFNDLGCYGAVSAVTPRLDALAGQGQRFTQFTTTGPGDVASQYALLTGRLARRGDLPATVPANSTGIDSREWTLAEAWRKAGHHTAFIGAWHLGDLSGSRPTDQGFAMFHGWPWSPALNPAPAIQENGSPITPVPGDLLDAITTRITNEIAAHSGEPFFLVFQPPTLPATGVSLLGSYGNRLEALDSSVGRILDQLSASNVENHTLVLFLSDGGADRNITTYPGGSNGQMRDGKGSTWEGGVRAPLIARWPGVIPAGDNEAVLWLPDIQRTLIDILHGYQPADRPLDGISRPDVLLGVRTRPDDATTLFLHRHTGSGYVPQAVRIGKWKLHASAINTDPDNTASTSTPLLFDLLVDPTEHVNRAASETGILGSLQQAMGTHEATFSAPVPQLPVAREPILGPVQSSTAQLAGTTATFTFTRPKDALNDHYIVQTGTDLTGWNDLPSAPYITIAAGASADTENVLVTIPLETLGAGSPSFFVRLKAVRP